jgi:ankyrin repeat protein
MDKNDEIKLRTLYDDYLREHSLKIDDERFQIFFQNGVNPNSRAGNLLIIYLCHNINKYNLEIFELLIKNVADINKNDCFPDLVIKLCENPKEHTFELIKLFIEYGVDVNAKDKYGTTPLLNVCTYPPKHATKIIELLLEYGADADARNNRGMTPLLNACTYSSKYTIKIIKLLFKYIVDVNAQNNDGETSLLNICKHQQLNVSMQLFVNKHKHSSEHNTKIIKLLLKYGADVNVTPSLLEQLCIHPTIHSIELIKLLCANGANIHKSVLKIVYEYPSEYSIEIIEFIQKYFNIDIHDILINVLCKLLHEGNISLVTCHLYLSRIEFFLKNSSCANITLDENSILLIVVNDFPCECSTRIVNIVREKQRERCIKIANIIREKQLEKKFI